MPSVDPRSRWDSVHGHSPRFMRSASSAMLRRDARINASVSSAGATGELLFPVATGMPSSLQAAKSIILEFRPTSAMSLSFGNRSEQGAGKFDPLANGNDDISVANTLDELFQSRAGSR